MIMIASCWWARSFAVAQSMLEVVRRSSPEKALVLRMIFSKMAAIVFFGSVCSTPLRGGATCGMCGSVASSTPCGGAACCDRSWPARRRNAGERLAVAGLEVKSMLARELNHELLVRELVVKHHAE